MSNWQSGIRSAQRIELIYDMCDDLTSLHLEIEAWHKTNPDPGKLKMDKFKTIIFPHQRILKTLDADYTKPLNEVRTILVRMKDEYMDLTMNTTRD